MKDTIKSIHKTLKKDTPEIKSIEENNEISEMPSDIKPMLATLVDKPFDDEGWIYEVKWDGFRALAYLQNGKVEIRSRNNKPFNDKFYPIYEELKAIKQNAILDGEIVVLNKKGLPDFAALQTWRSEADGQLAFYVFDILWFDGKNLMNHSLLERRDFLNDIIPKTGNIRRSENFNITGTNFFNIIHEMNLEGVIAKKADSKYTPDVRSKNWLKIKTEKHQEVLIGGYTKNENTSKLFSALMMGMIQNGELKYIGSVGTGFTLKMQKEILERLAPLKIKNCPFKELPEYNKPSRFRPNPPKAEVIWVKPELIAEISYKTVASDGAFRHPSFKGWRDDKKPSEIVKETALKTKVALKETQQVKSSVISLEKNTGRKSLLNPKDETQVRNINGHDLRFTNLSKVFWPDEKFTKRDLLNYYFQVAPFILPYIENRPQTLNRFPNGINGKSFYQKDVKGKVPEWIHTFPYYSHTDEREKQFLVCTDEASLLYIAGLGCIEINPWSSTTSAPENPDWCIIDLDPDQNTFDQVIQTAIVTKQILDAIEVNSFCKTSGSTGIHIYIPLGAKYTYEDSKEFGRAIATVIHQQLPSITSIERKTADRKGKMYIDFLQNRPQATVAGPYSVRPKPGATVSMPLHWDELKKGLQMKDFTIKNALSRIKEQGDIFSGVFGEGIDINNALEKLKGIS